MPISIFNAIVDFFKNQLTKVLSKFVLAAIVLLFGFIMGRLFGKLLLKILQELEINAFFRRILNIKLPLDELLSTLVAFLIYFFAIVSSLEILGLNVYFFNILAIGIIIIILLSIFVSFWGFIPNFVAGILIHQRHIVKNGDLIETKNIKGRIVHLGLIEAKLETKEKDVIYIPNSALLKEEHIRIKRQRIL